MAAASTWLEEEILGHRLSLFLFDGGKATAGKDLPCESQHHLQGWCPFLSPWPLSCDLLGNGFQIRAGRRFRTWMVLKTIDPMRKATFRKSPFFFFFHCHFGMHSKQVLRICVSSFEPPNGPSGIGSARQLRIGSRQASLGSSQARRVPGTFAFGMRLQIGEPKHGSPNSAAPLFFFFACKEWSA